MPPDRGQALQGAPPEVRRRSARRKAIVTPVFGQLKEDRGFAALSLALATGEYLLTCLAHNLGQLLRASAGAQDAARA